MGRPVQWGKEVDVSLFVRGMLIGVALAAPVGPIGVPCIRRTLSDGRVVGLVTGLGAGVTGWSALLLVLGVFLGSAGWWLLLSGGIGLLRSRITPSMLRWINSGAGLIILGFGLAALVASLMGDGCVLSPQPSALQV